MTVTWSWDMDPGPDHIDPAIIRRLRDRIDKSIDANRDRHIGLLQELLRLPTVSGSMDPQEDIDYRMAISRCLDRVQREAKSLGMEWRAHGGIAAVAEWPGRLHDGSIGVATHLDVVPAGHHWEHPPFSGDQIDGSIWGRGAQDDKGPAAMALAAVHVLRDLGITPDKDIRLMYGTLEETDDWPDIDLLLLKEQTPDVVLVPDGAFPIIVGEKGLMTVQWRADYDQPPTVDGLRFLEFEGGVRSNVVPDHAEMMIACEGGLADGERRLAEMPEVASVELEQHPPPSAGDTPCFRVTFEGRSCHAAFPEDGDNAVLKGLRTLRELMPGTALARFACMLTDHCTDLHGRSLGLHRSHRHLGDSTVNLGIAKLSPTGATAVINVRFPIGLTVEEVRATFHEAAQVAPDEVHVQTAVPGRPQNPLFISPEDHPHLIHSLQAAYRLGTGREPFLASIPGTTYAKAFPLAVSFGPQDTSAGEDVLAHEPNEHVRIDRHLENIRVYAIALALLACDPEEIERAADAS